MTSLVDPREFVIYFLCQTFENKLTSDMESGSSHEVHYRTVELWVDGPMTKCDDKGAMTMTRGYHSAQCDGDCAMTRRCDAMMAMLG